ncbi:MAG: hypothetical protein HN457_17110 [Opitutales bacterium]|jgi:hypothetical protein|nr:hypothetical protein [Opitutales bacterium]MDG2253996.1 hypothetical protein [Opitutaceae bacterium]MBT5168829.1 hypothetical protein [Opitutales bacterium]MBT5813602.1 hypothetical protein [Opitutales bacterium]MBT6379549.1 hypothetical protein [Opitutales bacterium]
MDSFLSGREHVGDQPKPKEETPSTSKGVLGDFQLQQAIENAQLEEVTGEAGSRVSYVMEEGRVQKIVVTCACGQLTEIDCKYEG